MKRNSTEFIAFDIETANDERSSICQIGMAKFINGTVVEKWSSLIQPEANFSSKNIHIHGIEPDHVIDCPSFDDIYPIIQQKLNNCLCISHTNFDVQSLSAAIEKYKLPNLSLNWLDSCLVAQNVWPNFNSHSLNSLAKNLNLSSFNHHDALDDALVCGKVILKAFAEKPQIINKLLSGKKSTSQLKQKTRLKSQYTTVKDNSFFSKISRKKVTVVANPDGVLFGESLVFTGSLSLSRTEAATLAADAGCEVKPTVTKKISYLVVGEQDLELTKGRKRSSKHRKAEEYISQGLPIQILTEKQFIELISR